MAARMPFIMPDGTRMTTFLGDDKRSDVKRRGSKPKKSRDTRFDLSNLSNASGFRSDAERQELAAADKLGARRKLRYLNDRLLRELAGACPRHLFLETNRREKLHDTCHLLSYNTCECLQCSAGSTLTPAARSDLYAPGRTTARIIVIVMRRAHVTSDRTTSFVPSAPAPAGDLHARSALSAHPNRSDRSGTISCHHRGISVKSSSLHIKPAVPSRGWLWVDEPQPCMLTVRARAKA